MTVGHKKRLDRSHRSRRQGKRIGRLSIALPKMSPDKCEEQPHKQHAKNDRWHSQGGIAQPEDLQPEPQYAVVGRAVANVAPNVSLNEITKRFGFPELGGREILFGENVFLIKALKNNPLADKQGRFFVEIDAVRAHAVQAKSSCQHKQGNQKIEGSTGQRSRHGGKTTRKSRFLHFQDREFNPSIEFSFLVAHVAGNGFAGAPGFGLDAGFGNASAH